jgi:uncharacterized membrane protein (Fun14 family)
MTNFLWGFVIGAVIVDFLWAWKMGIVTLVWSKISRVYNRIFRK